MNLLSKATSTTGIALMAIKKSDLHSSLWTLCDDPRGGMDASQYEREQRQKLFMIAEFLGALNRKEG
jgi:hypothetical protein